MNLNSQKKVWEVLGEVDPMWAILSEEEKRGGKWNATEFFSTGIPEVQSFLSDLESLNVSVEKRNVLDFGCGIGRATQAFSQYFDRCIGVDISSQMIVKAQEFNRAPTRCDYIINDRPDLEQFHSDTFDLVYSNIVLQHIKPRIAARYIREFVRVAKPGGLIVFQMPDWICMRRRVQWRRRLFMALQAVGVKGELLVRHGLNPMRMAFIPREKVESILHASNATIIDAKSWSDKEIGSCRYIAVKNNDNREGQHNHPGQTSYA
jgi:SAM-dependent methyltransferase